MKPKIWVRRWAVTESSSGLVDFYPSAKARAVDGFAQMHYSAFLSIFRIPLEPEKVYSLRAKGTARLS